MSRRRRLRSSKELSAPGAHAFRLSAAFFNRREFDAYDAGIDAPFVGGDGLYGADFGNACLKGAVLQEGDFTRARFQDANLESVRAAGARFGGAVLASADLRRADLTNADLRQSKMEGALLEGANLTGAKVAGLAATGKPAPGAKAEWLDTSGEGNGTARVTDEPRPMCQSVFASPRRGPVVAALASASALSAPPMMSDVSRF